MDFFGDLCYDFELDMAEAMRDGNRDLREFFRYRILRDKDLGYLLLYGGQLLGYLYCAFIALSYPGFAAVYALALLGALYLGTEKHEPDVGLPPLLATVLTIGFLVLWVLTLWIPI